MKKYVKPDLYFESFQLNQHIAACGLDLNFADTTSCESSGDTHGVFIDLGDVVLFAKDNGDCMQDLEEFCYTTAVAQETDDFKVFRS